jgi:hypothetical protein
MKGDWAVTIPTVASLRTRNRKLDRRRHDATRVITEMQRGASLHLTFTEHGSNFVLSNGIHVTVEIALMVVSDVRVCSVNDGLFPTTPQTWRYIEIKEDQL